LCQQPLDILALLSTQTLQFEYRRAGTDLFRQADSVLKKAFTRVWPDIEADIFKVKKPLNLGKPQRDPNEMVEEILTIVRLLHAERREAHMLTVHQRREWIQKLRSMSSLQIGSRLRRTKQKQYG
jgi:hypothetical protein